MSKLRDQFKTPEGRRKAFLSILLPVAFVGSSVTLYHLSRDTGWQTGTAWLVPVSLDTLAIYALMEYRNSQAEEHARRFAKWVGLGSLGYSVFLNVIGHLVTTHVIQITPWLVGMVGAIPPLSLGLAWHLSVLASAPVSRKRKAKDTKAETPPVKAPTPREPKAETPPVTEPAVQDEAPREPLHSVPQPPETETKATEDEILAWLRKQDKIPGRRPVMNRFGIGSEPAGRLVKQVKQEREAA